MKITVKSTPDNWEKENKGLKSNTVRFLDGVDFVEVVRTTDGATFHRVISDITTYKGAIIISWKEPPTMDAKPQTINLKAKKED